MITAKKMYTNFAYATPALSRQLIETRNPVDA